MAFQGELCICSVILTSNLAGAVLNLFLITVRKDGDQWPSRIRVDRGVENVLVCDAMVQFRGEGRGSFIAGPSTHNQRIERLWREVYRCVCHINYYIFMQWRHLGFLMLKIQFTFSHCTQFSPSGSTKPWKIFLKLSTTMQ